MTSTSRRLDACRDAFLFNIQYPEKSHHILPGSGAPTTGGKIDDSWGVPSFRSKAFPLRVTCGRTDTMLCWNRFLPAH